jgi:hypothetical protein
MIMIMIIIMFAVTVSAFHLNTLYIQTARWKAQTHPGCNNNTVICEASCWCEPTVDVCVCMFCAAGVLQHGARTLSCTAQLYCRLCVHTVGVVFTLCDLLQALCSQYVLRFTEYPVMQVFRSHYVK